ncbi:pro-FMRFamide-related neuropeptide VF [Dromiciops gliroides]|uniref:pro-FMRFamide-related neuropeptide VF n=1 Tax=Dromiciops gliroides TaxID=33562 RepID=UPI001CC4C069|nr:pro-FMRFamide-related neuropeptide VF [Dromiciops gliroides]
MEIISLKPFVVFILATSILLASRSVCADESVMSNLHDWEHYDEYLKPIGHPNEKKQRSLNPEELWQWDSNMIHKGQNPMTYKITQPMPHLPLRFGRSFEEERSVEPVANLPLKFGRNFNGGISRRIPNLPQRFGRAAVQSVMGSSIHLPQRVLGSPSVKQPTYPMASQPREFQAADEGELRTLDFHDYLTKKGDENKVSQEEWEDRREAPDPKVM